MALPSAKELKKLAAACRAAGIVHFKSGDIEFTLLTQAPPTKAAAKKAPEASAGSIGEAGEWDSMDEMEKILWSAPGLIGEGS